MLITIDFRRALLRALFLPAIIAGVAVLVTCLGVAVWLVVPHG